MQDDLDLVAKLSEEDRARLEHGLDCISPDDAKYGEDTRKLKDYLSARAEWKTCEFVQKVLLETRVEFGKAEQRHLDEVNAALGKTSQLNMSLLERKLGHDQLAVIEEMGRYISQETKALLHPGTTSYDPLDSARSYLFGKCWKEKMRPEVIEAIIKICELSESSMGLLRVGRTHLQNTSPVIFGGSMASYAARLAKRVTKCDENFGELMGKISGIVGTGASIDMVIGEGKSIEFEKIVLAKLGLDPDYTATQVVQKEGLADVGNSLVTLMHVIKNFANDTRMMYSSAIGEVTSKDSAKRLGGSSADATKNNPVNYENIKGKATIVESGMRVLYELIVSDFERDLSGSVMARYQPQAMMAETYEAFVRLNRALPQLTINEDALARNLRPVRKSPSEAMVAILRGEGWIHSKYGVGHDFVRQMGIRAKKQRKGLLHIALRDSEFRKAYENLPDNKKRILHGELELYTGSAKERAHINLDYARSVANAS